MYAPGSTGTLIDVIQVMYPGIPEYWLKQLSAGTICDLNEDQRVTLICNDHTTLLNCHLWLALVQVKFTYELNNGLIEQLPGRLSAGLMQ